MPDRRRKTERRLERRVAEDDLEALGRLADLRRDEGDWRGEWLATCRLVDVADDRWKATRNTAQLRHVETLKSAHPLLAASKWAERAATGDEYVLFLSRANALLGNDRVAELLGNFRTDLREREAAIVEAIARRSAAARPEALRRGEPELVWRTLLTRSDRSWSRDPFFQAVGDAAFAKSLGIDARVETRAGSGPIRDTGHPLGGTSRYDDVYAVLVGVAGPEDVILLTVLERKKAEEDARR